jgi:hypothetical protein
MKTIIYLALLFFVSAAIGAETAPAMTTVRTGMVVGVAAAGGTVSRVGTRLEFIDPTLLQAHGHWVPGMPSSQGYSPTTFPASQDAEPINVRAMRRYQQRWEMHLRDPQSPLSPTLYPSRFERRSA